MEWQSSWAAANRENLKTGREIKFSPGFVILNWEHWWYVTRRKLRQMKQLIWITTRHISLFWRQKSWQPMTACGILIQTSKLDKNHFLWILSKVCPRFRRNCYFEDEKKLKYFNKYSKIDCLEECLSDLYYELCRCVPYYTVRKSWMFCFIFFCLYKFLPLR